MRKFQDGGFSVEGAEDVSVVRTSKRRQGRTQIGMVPLDVR